jgi:hypothetical protein
VIRALKLIAISENITRDNINASVKKLCDIFVDSAQTTFGTYKNKRKNLNRKPKGVPFFNSPIYCVIGALKLIVACGFFIKLKSCNKDITSEYKREKSTTLK